MEVKMPRILNVLSFLHCLLIRDCYLRNVNRQKGSQAIADSKLLSKDVLTT